MTKEQAAEKLKKLKNLAERGVDGEKETALRLYEELKEKYSIEDQDLSEARQQSSGGEDERFFEKVMTAWSIQKELEVCDNCPYTNGEAICEECGTYENIKDLCLQYEELMKGGQQA